MHWERAITAPSACRCPILRPFNTFGPRQSARAIIPTIISQALTRPVVKLGRLDPRRDLTYVKDTAGGFVAIASCDAALGRAVNIGRGEDISIGELVERIGRLLGRTLKVETEADRVRPAGQRGRAPARRHGPGPVALGLEAPVYAWTRGSRRRSPGSASTSAGSGSTNTRPECCTIHQSMRRLGPVLGLSDTRVRQAASPSRMRATWM